MLRMIAGVYEIEREIGAGAGGIVYLGRHSRLNKSIVLKADKRKLSTKLSDLRREVDMLKSLSNSYIPQVYDFVEEDGVVYTVMEWIDGESFDKILERGERPSQAQIIRWACQLLDALHYLHSQPPYGILHGDIKPANIMLRKNGDICLIDYNIALALGEDGAVKVGLSHGYASPEHYGISFIEVKSPISRKTSYQAISGIRDTVIEDDKTEYLDESGMTDTLSLEEYEKLLKKKKSTTSTYEKKVLQLDVRSDIYSLGASLYHILSQKKPNKNAAMIDRLGEEYCSAKLAGIIEKAMHPVREKRYQTAQDMLKDLLNIHKQDIRTIRHIRSGVFAFCGIISIFLLGGGMTFLGLKQEQNRNHSIVLSEYSANALAKGDVASAVDLALEAIPKEKDVLHVLPVPEAQYALTEALAVYRLDEEFLAKEKIELPTEPFKLVASSDKKYFALVYAYETRVYDFATGENLATFPMQNSALSDVMFSGHRIVYSGKDGVTVYDLQLQSPLWQGKMATTLCMSTDENVLAAINKDEDVLTLYRMENGDVILEKSLDGYHLPVSINDIMADPGGIIFSLNEDGTMLAMSSDAGGLILFHLGNPDEDLIVYDTSNYDTFEGVFYKEYFVYTATDGVDAILNIVDTTTGELYEGLKGSAPFQIRLNVGKLYISNGQWLEELNLETMEEKEILKLHDAQILDFSVAERYTLISTTDARFCFYNMAGDLLKQETSDYNMDFVCLTENKAVVANRNSPEVRVLELNEKKDAKLWAYDPNYIHEEARISKDGQHLMLFGISGFLLYDLDGQVVKKVELPDSRSIYDQQFRKEEESYLEVIWYNGMIRKYSARTGELLSEEQKEAPSKDLQEEFVTSKYRIESGLHQQAKVYDKESGTFLANLEKDAHLTYIDEIGDHIVANYVAADGEKFGILLDRDLKKIANLPYLCDAYDGELFFDYPSGNICRVNVYTLPELVDLAKKIQSKGEGS